jgi:hypothetical protein
MLWLAISAGAGCSGGDAAPDARPRVDARAPDLSCIDDVYPDVVPDPIAYGGLVFEPGLTGSSADAPIGGATLRARASSSTNVIATAVSGDDGRFELTLATGGEPLFTYLQISHLGYFESRAYLPTAVFEARDDVEVALFTQQHIDSLNAFAGVTLAPDESVMIVRAFDCLGIPLEGATLTTTPAPLTQLYLAPNGLPDYNLTSTTSNGAVALFKVDPGSVQVEGEFRGRAMRAYSLGLGGIGTNTITSAGIVP